MGEQNETSANIFSLLKDRIEQKSLEAKLAKTRYNSLITMFDEIKGLQERQKNFDEASRVEPMASEISPGTSNPLLVNPKGQPTSADYQRAIMPAIALNQPESLASQLATQSIIDKVLPGMPPLKGPAAIGAAPLQGGGVPQAPPGQTPGGPLPQSAPNTVIDIISRAAKGDSAALMQASVLKMGGLDLIPAIDVARKGGEILWKEAELPGDNSGDLYVWLTDKQGTFAMPTQIKAKSATPVAVEVTSPDRSKRTQFVYPRVEAARGQTPRLGPKPTGGTQAPQGPGIQTAPSELDMIVPESDLTKYRDANGRPAPAGSTLRWLKENGYNPVSSATESSILSGKQVNATLNVLDGYVKKIFTAESPMQRVLQAPSAMYGVASQSNKDAVLYDGFAQGTLAPLIRAFGEKGNLSDTDIKRAMNLVPRYWPVPDTKEVAQGKVKILKGLISAFQAGNYLEAKKIISGPKQPEWKRYLTE